MRLNARQIRAASAIILATVSVATASGTAPADGTPPQYSYVTPAHAWIDPALSNDHHTFPVAFEYHFVPPEGAWSVHSTTPDYTTKDPHCVPAKSDVGANVYCTGGGEGYPGDYEVRLTVRPEGAEDFDLIGHLTVCEPGRCSTSFDLAVEPAAATACPGNDLSQLGEFSYQFNVPWNASDATFGDLPGVSVSTEPPADGGTFRLAGSIAEPGEHTLDVTVTDEFGGVHLSELSITVPSAGESGCPGLAPTGANESRALFVGLPLTIFGIVFVVVARRRRSPVTNRAHPRVERTP